MDIIYECANNFIKLENKKYHFVFVQNRKSHDIILDFYPSDFRHATGLHHVTDIVIENNPVKLMDVILSKESSKVTDIKLNESKKYKEVSPTSGSIKERVSDMRFIEQCLDTSDFMRIFKIQPYGSQIRADYFIEAYCEEIKANWYDYRHLLWCSKWCEDMFTIYCNNSNNFGYLESNFLYNTQKTVNI